MEIEEKDTGFAEIDSFDQSREERRKDQGVFLKGFIIGFGAAAAAGMIFGLFKDRAEKRRESTSTGARIRSQDESGGVIGDLSNIIDESSSAFKDAVRTLDRTFESGRMAIESFQDIIDKIRE